MAADRNLRNLKYEQCSMWLWFRMRFSRASVSVPQGLMRGIGIRSMLRPLLVSQKTMGSNAMSCNFPERDLLDHRGWL